jgi:hypothetical protein
MMAMKRRTACHHATPYFMSEKTVQEYALFVAASIYQQQSHTIRETLLHLRIYILIVKRRSSARQVTAHMPSLSRHQYSIERTNLSHLKRVAFHGQAMKISGPNTKQSESLAK